MKFVLLLFIISKLTYSQKRDSIFYDGEKYKINEIILFYKDTVFMCEKNISFRFTKDTIFVYKPKYYKKIKRNK